MKKIILLVMLLIFVGYADAATKIGLDRLNWSQSLPSNESITMNNGSLENASFITFAGDAPTNTTGALYVNDSNIMFNGARIDQNILSDNVNIKDYGAIGDGVTNDTEAFNAAVAECNDVWSDAIHSISKTLYLPDGIYNLTPGATTPIACNIYGPGAVLRAHTTADSPLIQVGTTAYKNIELKALEGYYTPLTVEDGEAWTVADIFTGTGISLQGDSTGDAWIMDCDIKINTIQGFKTGIYFDGPSNGAHIATNFLKVNTIKWCHTGLSMIAQEYQVEDNLIDILYVTGCNVSVFVSSIASSGTPYLCDNIFNIYVIEAHRTGSVSGVLMVGANTTQNQFNINKILSGPSTSYEFISYGNAGQRSHNNSINIVQPTNSAKIVIIGQQVGNAITSLTPLTVSVRNSAGTTITGGGATTKIPFATETSDRWGMWSNDTFTAKSAGEASITGSILINTYSQTQGKKYHVYIYKNGAVGICAGTFLETGGTAVLGINIEAIIGVNPGDTLDVRVLREGTGDQTLLDDAMYNWLKIAII